MKKENIDDIKSKLEVNEQRVDELVFFGQKQNNHISKIREDMIDFQLDAEALRDDIQRCEEKINQVNVEVLQKMTNQNEVQIAEFKKLQHLVAQHEEKLGLANDIFYESNNFWRKISTAQCGEDMIVAYILKVIGFELMNATYLDLGANHAKDLSNTYYLYEHGARGVLVEANPALIPELKLFRSEDIIINKCIADKPNESIRFYVLNGDGLSTTDKKSAEQAISQNPGLFIEREIDVATITAEDILKQYFAEAPTLVNVDIEGQELEVLKSLKLDSNRPLIIIVEMITYRNSLVLGNKDREILEYMEVHDYQEFAFTGINSIFVDRLQMKDKFKAHIGNC